MKKKLLLVTSFIFLTIGIATAGGHNLTSVKDEGDQVVITITNVRMTPIGKNTAGKGLAVPDTIDIFSGVSDAGGGKLPIVSDVKIINGEGSFKIPNWAKDKKVSYVEHLWGLSPDKKFALVIDPADPWACYKVNNGTPDLNTLAIGIIMYLDQPTAPLKPYGKLPQGEHPELAGN